MKLTPVKKLVFTAACTASKAIKALGRRKDGKGRRFFAVKGAKTVEVRARPLQRYVRADNLLDVVAEDNFINNRSWYHSGIPLHTFGTYKSE